MGQFPKWVAEEILRARFAYVDTMRYAGYPLEIDKADRRIDVQFYDRLPDGRYIATLDASEPTVLDGIERAEIYLFSIKVYIAELSGKAAKYIREEYGVSIDKIYRFELVSAEKMG